MMHQRRGVKHTGGQLGIEFLARIFNRESPELRRAVVQGLVRKEVATRNPVQIENHRDDTA
jgi:hypothetical protein